LNRHEARTVILKVADPVEKQTAIFSDERVADYPQAMFNSIKLE
jgi:hypothetical protein